MSSTEDAGETIDRSVFNPSSFVFIPPSDLSENVTSKIDGHYNELFSSSFCVIFVSYKLI
jgi:hypothetical protein